NDPTIRLEEQRSISSGGAAQIQTGQFDPLLTADLSYNFTQQHLLLSQLTTERNLRRDVEKDIARETAQADINEPDFRTAVSELTKLQGAPDTYMVDLSLFRSGANAMSFSKIGRAHV